MAEENTKAANSEQAAEERPAQEPYGWEFHKVPLLIALVLTVIFYAFVFFFIHF